MTTDLFRGFTARARHTMTLAGEEARYFSHDHVGTEHMLLGLIREGGGVAALTLKHFCVGLREARHAVMRTVGCAPAAMAARERPISGLAKDAIDYAGEAARGMRHDFIDTEHLLLGLLKDGSGMQHLGDYSNYAKTVLVNMGVDLSELREMIVQINLGGEIPEATITPTLSPKETAMKQKITSVHTSDVRGMPAGGETTSTGMVIQWQNGPLGRGDDRQEPNGAFVETVIEAAKDRLEYYQGAGFACVENEIAIASLSAALAVLQNRTARRERAGVEGTHGRREDSPLGA